MARAPVLSYEEYWQIELQSLRTEFKDIIKQHPEAREARQNTQCTYRRFRPGRVHS